MVTKEQFILLLFHFAIANSFVLMNIRNLNEDELINKLVKVLNDEKNERTYLKNYVDVRRSRKDLHDAHKRFDKLRRVKNRNNNGTHDVKSQTEDEPIYKMLKRIHKKIPMFIKENNEYRIQNIGRTGTQGLERDKSTRSDNVAKFWQNLKNLKNSFLEKGKKHERSKLRSLRQEKRQRSRSHLRGRSGEENDPLAPGKVPYNIDLYEETTVRTEKWLPSYPYWNYWTYEKSLYQDDCKGDTIKVGALCIRPPPH